MRKPSKKDKFLALAKPDKYGFSRMVPIEELEKNDLGFGNGGSWCREDGALAKQFNVERKKEKNRIVGVRLHGWKKNPIQKTIPPHIRKMIVARPCAVLHTGRSECDHKDGRLDGPSANPDDFQPLCKAVNNAKRQHCKKCRETEERFDARVLGYRKGQWAGNGRYMGSCTGCYWHDPHTFNQKASENWGVLRGTPQANGPGNVEDA